jgi:hypothetical protein
MNKQRLRLYVWEDVMWDYTGGIAFALARSQVHARKKIVEKWGGKDGLREYRKWKKDHRKRGRCYCELWNDLERPGDVITKPEGFARAGNS